MESSNKQQPSRDVVDDANAATHERDQATPSTTTSTAHADATTALHDDAKPVFHTLGFDDAPDQLQYRSMAKTISAAGPPSLGLMRGGLMSFSGLPGAPMAFATAGKSNKAASSAFAMGSSMKKATDTTPTVGVRVDRTKYVGVLPRALPPLPFRLERHTLLHVKRDAAIQRVCSVVGRVLCERDTDFAFERAKCKWTVAYRREGSGAQRVTLHIVVFAMADKLVVEVQRRDGDIAALMHLFRDLHTSFKRHQLLVDNVASGASNAGTKRSVPMCTTQQLPTTQLSTADVRDGVMAVTTLLNSKYADTQRQGVLAAISLAAQDGVRAHPALAALVPQLVALGQSQSKSVTQLVGVALARLCDEPACRTAFVATPGWQFIVDCAAGGDSIAPEHQRASLHVVASLCALYHDELARAPSAPKVLALVRDWQHIDDPRLQQHACSAHKALEAAGAIAIA